MQVRYIDLVNRQNDPVKAVNELANDPVKRNILNCLQQNPKATYIEMTNDTGYSTSKQKDIFRS